MITEASSTLSDNAAGHVRHAMAAIYVAAGIYAIWSLLRIDGIAPQILAMACVGLGLLFGSIALFHIRGTLAPRTHGGAAFSICVSVVTVLVMNAYSLNFVAQMTAEQKAFDIKEKAACMNFGEEFFAKRPELQAMCKEHREPISIKP